MQTHHTHNALILDTTVTAASHLGAAVTLKVDNEEEEESAVVAAETTKASAAAVELLLHPDVKKCTTSLKKVTDSSPLWDDSHYQKMMMSAMTTPPIVTNSKKNKKLPRTRKMKQNEDEDENEDISESSSNKRFRRADNESSDSSSSSTSSGCSDDDDTPINTTNNYVHPLLLEGFVDVFDDLGYYGDCAGDVGQQQQGHHVVQPDGQLRSSFSSLEQQDQQLLQLRKRRRSVKENHVVALDFDDFVSYEMNRLSMQHRQSHHGVATRAPPTQFSSPSPALASPSPLMNATTTSSVAAAHVQVSIEEENTNTSSRFDHISQQEKLLLDEMDQCIVELPNDEYKVAYNKAAYNSPEYVVHNTTFKLAFLRSEQYNPKAAANKYIKHFHIKHELFGENNNDQYPSDILGRDLRYEDLSQDDIQCLKEGTQQLLPTRDHMNRLILCMMPTQTTIRSTNHVLSMVSIRWRLVLLGHAHTFAHSCRPPS